MKYYPQNKTAGEIVTHFGFTRDSYVTKGWSLSVLPKKKLADIGTSIVLRKEDVMKNIKFDHLHAVFNGEYINLHRDRGNPSNHITLQRDTLVKNMIRRFEEYDSYPQPSN